MGGLFWMFGSMYVGTYPQRGLSDVTGKSQACFGLSHSPGHDGVVWDLWYLAKIWPLCASHWDAI